MDLMVKARPLKLRDIEIKIINSLKKLARTRGSIDRLHLTQDVKNELQKIGETKGYASYAGRTKRTAHFHEFLWDFVWARQKEDRRLKGADPNKILSLPLIAEIEWGTSKQHRAHDFEKLIFGEASLRLFVCRTRNEDDSANALKLCRDILSRATRPKRRRFLLIMVQDKPKKIIPQLWIR